MSDRRTVLEALEDTVTIHCRDRIGKKPVAVALDEGDCVSLRNELRGMARGGAPDLSIHGDLVLMLFGYEVRVLQRVVPAGAPEVMIPWYAT